MVTLKDFEDWPAWDEFCAIEQPRKIKAWVSIAEKMAADNGGTLPNCFTLLKNDGWGLYAAMRRSPKNFTHIKQDKKIRRTTDEWVVFAEKFAQENGGVLFCVRHLRKMGYASLNAAMRRSPKKFAHIKQDKLIGGRPKNA